jgi:hypothetical protein
MREGYGATGGPADIWETGLCSKLTLSYLPGMSGVLRYWGFVALGAAIIGWVTGTLTLVLILILAAGAFGYFLLQAPVWCGAMTREGQMCRNNSTGLLLGCHLREHKWQKLRMTFVPRK